jgi:GWxTD domain-containing protein
MKKTLVLLVLPALLAASPSAAAEEAEEDWSKSAEAYFLTSEEKQEWARLASSDARRGFIERYWLKRDPTAGTAHNEFRQAILGRIQKADQRYPLRGRPGSRTAQGFVFVVFGSPARVQQRHVGLPPQASERPAADGARGKRVGTEEGTETLYSWVYDLERTRPILEFLKIPSLSIDILIEPQKNRDDIQNPGLVNEYRERLARGTIVNPDLVPPRD